MLRRSYSRWEAHRLVDSLQLESHLLGPFGAAKNDGFVTSERQPFQNSDFRANRIVVTFREFLIRNIERKCDGNLLTLCNDVLFCHCLRSRLVCDMDRNLRVPRKGVQPGVYNFACNSNVTRPRLAVKSACSNHENDSSEPDQHIETNNLSDVPSFELHGRPAIPNGDWAYLLARQPYFRHSEVQFCRHYNSDFLGQASVSFAFGRISGTR